MVACGFMGVFLLPLTTDDPGLQAVTPLFILLLVLQLAPSVWSFRVDTFSPPVFGGLYAGLGTVSIMASSYSRGRLDVSMVSGLSLDEMIALGEKTLYAMILATVAYYIGYYGRKGVRWRALFPRVDGLEWDLRIAFRLMLGVLVIFFIAYAYFQISVGVPLLEFRRLDAGKSVWRGRPELSWMIRGVELAFVPLLLFAAARISERRLTRVIPIVVAFAVVGALVIRLGYRARVMMIGLVMLLVCHYLWRRIPALVFGAALFLAVPISNVLLTWRTTLNFRGPGEETFAERIQNPSAQLAEHEEDRDRFGAMAIVMREFPDRRAYLLGESWLALLVVPIPRWLWPEKDEHFTWRESRIVGNLGGGNMPAPFHAVLYANFSWIGVFVGMLFWGRFHRGMYEWLMANPGDKSVVLLYGVSLSFVSPTLLGVSAAMQYVLPLYVFLRIIGHRQSFTPESRQSTEKALLAPGAPVETPGRVGL